VKPSDLTPGQSGAPALFELQLMCQSGKKIALKKRRPAPLLALKPTTNFVVSIVTMKRLVVLRLQQQADRKTGMQ
jgi:hypothetical protein